MVIVVGVHEALNNSMVLAACIDQCGIFWNWKHGQCG